MVITLSIALLHQELRGLLGLAGAEIRRFQDGAEGAFGGHRILADELPVPSQHAAEVLRPGSVHGAVNHHMADLLLPHLLRFGGKA